VTLKGGKNHYNVKFLSGYGLSISLKDNKIVLKNGTYPYSENQEKEEWFITKLPYEKIVISGKGYISTEALALLNENNRNVILTDSYGKPVSQMSGLMDSRTATRYRMAQYDTFRDPQKCSHLTRWILKEKLGSQIKFLEFLSRDDSKETISIIKNHTNQIENSHEPSKIESKAGKVYFRYYYSLFDEKYRFESRNNSSLRITHRRASDPINALLNYGYAVLAGEIYKFVNGIGLDAYFGFNHSFHTGFQPLVYDIIEPFR
jgi:CRISPR-associated protein Cas1